MVEYVHILSLAVSWTIDIGDVERYGDPCCLRETQPRPCHHMSSMSCAAGSNVSSPLNSQFSVVQVSRTSFVDFVGLDDLDDLDDLDEDDEVSRSHLKCLSNNYTKTWDFSGSQRLYNINQTIYSVCLNMFEWRMKYVTHTRYSRYSQTYSNHMPGIYVFIYNSLHLGHVLVSHCAFSARMFQAIARCRMVCQLWGVSVWRI